jgi:hypothetical protein
VQQRLGFTRREQELIPLIAKGLTNKEIANDFCLSEQTVKRSFVPDEAQDWGGGSVGYCAEVSDALIFVVGGVFGRLGFSGPRGSVDSAFGRLQLYSEDFARVAQQFDFYNVILQSWAGRAVFQQIGGA